MALAALGLQSAQLSPVFDVTILFIGRLGPKMHREELLCLLEPFGRVLDLAMPLDRLTQRHRGYALVTFSRALEASICRVAMHGQLCLGLQKPVQVVLYRPEVEDVYRKLYVAFLSDVTSSEDVRDVFDIFGVVEDCHILLTKKGISKNSAFVTFINRQMCLKALKSLDGRVVPSLGSKPLLVRFAEDKTPPSSPSSSPEPQDFSKDAANPLDAPILEWSRAEDYDLSESFWFGRLTSSSSSCRDNCNVIVRQLPEFVRQEQLRALFAQFGAVATTQVYQRPGTRSPLGFVRFRDPGGARNAVRALDGFQVAGRRLKVAFNRQ